MTRNAAFRLRYRKDPEFRKKHIAKAMKYTKHWRQDPLFRELSHVRKRVTEVRRSYERLTARAEARFVELQDLIKRRDALATQWKARKKTSK